MTPNSRLTEAIAATQGVYSRQKTSSEAAAAGVMTAAMPPSAPNSTSSTETTLSFAMNPLMSEVTIRQSPRPSGIKSGVSSPAIEAKMLSCESVAGFRRKSKLCRNHTTMVAMRITENARCKKSFAFSQSSCMTLRGLGRR